MFSVVLPYSSEMRLICYLFLLFMRIDDILLVKKLRSHLTQSIILSLVFLTAFWGGGVHTEDQRMLLISMSE